MILQRAKCGHFVIFDEDGSVFQQICRCRIEIERRGAIERDARFFICDKCGGQWFGGLVHAPRLVGAVVKDCSGDEVKNAST